MIFDQMKCDISESKIMAKDLLDKAIEVSKSEGSYYFPTNFGNIVLGLDKAPNSYIERCAEIYRKNIPSKKSEGVRDEDILNWLNRNDVERNIVVQFDNVAKMAMFINEFETSKETTEEKIAEKGSEKIRKYFPFYGNPNDTSHTTGDDRPIPYELKDRVNIYVEKVKHDPEKFKSVLEKYSSYNAFIRKEIRDGNL